MKTYRSFLSKKYKKLLFIILLFLLSFVMFLLILFQVGKYQLLHRLTQPLQATITEEERFYFSTPMHDSNIFSYEKNTPVTIDNETYVPNDKLLVLYFLGIDQDTPVSTKATSEGGQADAHILIFIDMQSKQIQLVTINRNAMTDIDIYDINDQYGYTIPGQLCLQHAYGDGMENSCMRSSQTMERFLYDAPLHSYLSLQKGIIAAINDGIGGVEVTALEDVIFPEPETIIHKGEDILLLGSNAYYYLTFRYVENFGSNNTRLERQQQYLDAFINKLTNACKQNILLPFTLYQKAKDYMVTDLSLPEMLYLGYMACTYEIDTNIYSLPGTTTAENENAYESFYIDQNALSEMILDYYYIQQ